MAFEYLGTSIQYPLLLTNGSPVLISGLPNVEQSIRTLLSESIGRKFFLPEYGSRTEELLFEQNDDVLKEMMRLFIFEALEKWETRVKFTDCDFTFEDDHVDCHIKYKVLPSNEINSFVFPFYRELKY